MVDFAGLVLVPCMEEFAAPTDRNQPITWFPVVSNSSSPARPGMRGIWKIVDMDVMLEDGSIVSTSTITLGILLSDWPWYPQVGDVLTAPLGTYTIDKVRVDGMGGASLVVKAGQPLPTTG